MDIYICKAASEWRMHRIQACNRAIRRPARLKHPSRPCRALTALYVIAHPIVTELGDQIGDLTSANKE